MKNGVLPSILYSVDGQRELSFDLFDTGILYIDGQGREPWAQNHFRCGRGHRLWSESVLHELYRERRVVGRWSRAVGFEFDLDHLVSGMESHCNPARLATVPRAMQTFVLVFVEAEMMLQVRRKPSKPNHIYS